MPHPFRYHGTACVLLAVTVAVLPARVLAEGPTVDLSRAVIVNKLGRLSGPEKKAVELLADEVERRTQLRWRVADDWPTGVPVIAIGRPGTLRAIASGPDPIKPVPAPQPEGYRIDVYKGSGPPKVLVSGYDVRGVLYGVGRLLRALTMEKRRVTLPAAFAAAAAPRYALRGHQLGYRPKTNSYDGWDLPRWEQYVRDLAVFGANAVELIPPRSDDAPDSPHFPRPQLEMMAGVSKVCDDYGLDVWVWYPALDKDYSDPKTVESALQEWGEVFKALPRVDAVFVPGGDPGHTRPRYLMALLQKQTEVLHRYHPKATMWVSPQGFTPEWMGEFFDLLKAEPSWLAGVVHGPGTRLTTEELRAAVPRRYAIRSYPDIAHSRTCQFPVPDWDAAFALTEGREPINPRPRGHARILRRILPPTIGFITYSEGCNDDVNKAVWSALGWDPEADVVDILRQYGRYFIGPDYADAFAQALLALERNWQGPVLTNAGIYTTLQQFQAMERSAGPRELQNWRFQQALYRAYYDAHVRGRLLHETRLEDDAMAALRRAGRRGALKALEEAERVLARAETRPVAEDLRARVFELGEALFQSIHMQLSVGRYKALSVNRGANLDTIDRPLNSRAWLLERFAEIRRLDVEADRLKRIDQIVHWTDPGPGGFYDDLGNPACQPHLVRGPGAAQDPAFHLTAATVFEDRPAARKSWWDQAMGHYELPLTLRYTGLDPVAHYRVRAVYGAGPMRLLAGEGLEVHPPLNRPYEPVEFAVPPAATAGGSLELRWYGQRGRPGGGRGCQVAEVWLIKQSGQ